MPQFDLLPLSVLWLAVNVISFALFGADKRRARKERWRIPEKTLFAFALLGGCTGAILGMKVFHHKTRHKRFTIGLPLIFLLQTALLVFAVLKGGFFHG